MFEVRRCENEERKRGSGDESPSPSLPTTFFRSGEPLLVHRPSYSRRALTRLQAVEDIWVCWRCNGRDDISRVLDISHDGLFLETPQLAVKEGMPAKVDFLVQEGRIKADAVVRHVKRGNGLGLWFLFVDDADRARLKTLLARLRSSPA